VPDPLHVLDPLRFYTQQLLRISPFFINGSAAVLTTAEQELLDLVAKYGDSDDALKAERQAQVGKTNAELQGTVNPATGTSVETAPAGGRRGASQAASGHAQGFVACAFLAPLSVLVLFVFWH
jgi:hypothetical protein